MRRSLRAFATSLAAFLLTLAVPAAPALAASGQIVSPVNDATVGGSVVTIQIQASRGFLEGAIDTVKVRISQNGSDAAPGTQVVDATCSSGCGGTEQTWTLDFDPMSFSPFGTPSAGRCNGGWWLQASIGGNPFGTGVQVVRSLAPSSPSNVTAAGGTEEATVRWTRAPEADVVGYLVERRQGTGSWTTVANLGASADRHTDDVAAGTWSYRVVTLRGDGRTGDGSAAAPCADTGADLAAASKTVTTEVEPAETSTDGGSTTGGSTTGSTSGSTTGGSSGSTTTDGGTTDGGTTDGGTTDGGTTDGGTTDGGTTDGGTTDGGTTDGGTTDGADGGTTDGSAPTRRVGPRQAAPPPFDSGPNYSGSLDVGSQDPLIAQERYFGEDDEFSETLDFGDAEAIVGEDLEATTETRTIRVPGALQTFLGEELDVMRLYGSIAAGLVLITFALHLRRWMRAGIVD